MENNVWVSIIVPLVISLMSGIGQLLIEYYIIQPALRKPANDRPAQQQLDSEVKPPRLANLGYTYLGVARVLIIIILTFGSVSMAGGVGYERGGFFGIVGGIAIGLVLTLIAMWAIYRWSDALAKAASFLALAGLITLVLAGLFTLVAKLAGFSIEFSGGLLAVILVILFILVSIILFVGLVILGIGGVALSGFGARKSTDEGPPPTETRYPVDTSSPKQSSPKKQYSGGWLLHGQPPTEKRSLIGDSLRKGFEAWARGEADERSKPPAQSSPKEESPGGLLHGQPSTEERSFIGDLLRKGFEDWARGESNDKSKE